MECFCPLHNTRRRRLVVLSKREKLNPRCRWCSIFWIAACWLSLAVVFLRLNELPMMEESNFLLSDISIPENQHAVLNIGNVSAHLESFFTGTYQFEATQSCALTKRCLIHFPYTDLEDPSPDRVNTHKDSVAKNHDHAVLTRHGSRKPGETADRKNQDRAFIISNIGTTEASSSPDWLLALFDGHGSLGHYVAQRAAFEFAPLLVQKFQESASLDPMNAQAVFETAFQKVDQALQSYSLSGSTAVTAIKVGSRLYIANTGDSEAFIARVTSPTITGADPVVTIGYQTTKHKPDMPEERSRIEKAGGVVITPRNNAHASSRVIISIPSRGMQLALAMSRSLGEPEAKAAGYVIARPQVDVLDVSQPFFNPAEPAEFFIVAASDGLFDKIPKQHVAECVSKAIQRRQGLLQTSYHLIEASSRLWRDVQPGYRDDITVAIKTFHLQ